MTTWLQSLPPGVIMAVGGLLLLALRGRALQFGLVVLPVVSYGHLLALPAEHVVQLTIMGLDLVPVRIDRLAMVWGHVFHWAAILSAVYALHVQDRVQHAAAIAYAGSAVAAVFAGDLVTLFVHWELTAVTSVFLIWSRDDRARKDRDPEECYRAGLRYLIIQVASGVVLLAGICLRWADGGGLEFEGLATGDITSAPLWAQLVFLAFGIKAAFPFLHNWLQDAYPRGTHTGTVFLSAFTTKMAIYALARGFAGTDLLVPLGVAMTLFPIFFAVIENDLRKVLAYSLNNQLGFMCVGIGIGTELALQGAAGHAFAHILYKALLFQSMGAVLWSVGTCKATELGGLFKRLPVTALCCMVAAASISAFPLTSGFVTKSMTLSAAAEGHMTLVWLLLLFASAGVLEHSGIKIPYFAFLAPTKKDWSAIERPPWNMRAAMVTTAVLCLGIGVFPGVLYRFLDFQIEYEPYTALHVVGQLQLLLFATAAFVWLVRIGAYPHEKRATILDFDWIYRRALPAGWDRVVRRSSVFWTRGGRLAENARQDGLVWIQRWVGDGAALTQTRTIRGIALWVLAALAVGLAWVFWLH
ncbi:MAG: Na(+)/H(+) antiporter subunit D [Thermoanaerobaculia bacterium]|nr:Na(+)/H(+) antiporter subunit D [Thermoanaerobaculia bacterium]